MTSGVGLSETATALINCAAERGERLLGANVHIPCVRGPIVDPIALAAAGPVEQAQVAMVWLACGLDFQIAEYDAMYKALEDLKLDATRMVGMGISPRMTEGSKESGVAVWLAAAAGRTITAAGCGALG